MTSEHIREVLEFMDRESARNMTKEEIIKDWQELGYLDSNGNYAAPYQHLGMWLKSAVEDIIMISKHMQEVIEFVMGEIVRKKRKEEAIKKFQEIGFLDSNGNYTAPYRNLGRWIDDCTRRSKEQAILATFSLN